MRTTIRILRLIFRSRPVLRVAIFLCFLPFPAFAQNSTAVNATIVDPTGIPYSYATVQAQLVPTGVTPTLNGQVVSSFSSGTTNAAGTFNMTLASNSVLVPSGTQWQFTINENGLALPVGTGPQQIVSTITISGASQNISATLNALAQKLTNIGGGSIGGSVTPTHLTFASGANTVGDVAGTAVTAGTGAISLTASADNVSPITLFSHSGTQSAPLFNAFNSTTQTLRATYNFLGGGQGAFPLQGGSTFPVLMFLSAPNRVTDPPPASSAIQLALGEDGGTDFAYFYTFNDLTSLNHGTQFMFTNDNGNTNDFLEFVDNSGTGVRAIGLSLDDNTGFAYSSIAEISNSAASNQINLGVFGTIPATLLLDSVTGHIGLNAALVNTNGSYQLPDVAGTHFITLNNPSTLAASYNWNYPTTACTAGQLFASGGGGSAPITCVTPGVVPRAQTTTSDTVLAGDRGNGIVENNAGAIAESLPQNPTAGFASNFYTYIKNIGAGLVTITPGSGQISGNNGTLGATLTVATSSTAYCYSDNTNYQCTVVSPSSGGSNSLTALAKTASYTAVSGDFSTPTGMDFTCTAACVLTLPAAAPAAGGYIVVNNVVGASGPFAVTVYPNGLALNGFVNGSIIVAPNHGVLIRTDGVGYKMWDGNNSMPRPADRRWGYWKNTGSSLTTGIIGIGTFSSQGTAQTNFGTTAGTEPPGFDLGTSAVLNNTSYLNQGGSQNLVAKENILFQESVRLPSITSDATHGQRTWIGLFHASGVTMLGSDTPTDGSIGFRASWNNGTGDTNWMACTAAAGAAATCTSTGVALSTNLVTLSFQELKDLATPAIAFWVNGQLTNVITANIPVTSVLLEYIQGVQNLSTTAAHVRIHWGYIEDDHY